MIKLLTPLAFIAGAAFGFVLVVSLRKLHSLSREQVRAELHNRMMHYVKEEQYEQAIPIRDILNS